MKKIVLMLVFAATLTSCYNTRLLVGSVKAEEPMVAVNTQWCNQFLFGLIPGTNATMKPSDYVNSSSYVVRTHTTFLNGLVSGVTFGIYTPTQTTYYLPTSAAAQNMQEKNAKKLKTLIMKKY